MCFLCPAHTLAGYKGLQLGHRLGEQPRKRPRMRVFFLSSPHTVPPPPQAAPPTANLPPALATIVTAFAAVPDPKLKYAQLLAYGKKLPPLDAGRRTAETKVRGCVSQVWVVPERRPDGALTWLADSDSALTKGLAALLVQGLSGVPPEDVVRLSPDWIASLGLAQSLTPSRNNGFLNMFLTMQKLCIGMLEGGGGGGGCSSGRRCRRARAPPPADAPPSKPVAAAIHAKLTAALSPSTLDIEDQSSQHAGHAGGHFEASPSGESHFRVRIVAAAFAGKNTVARHRLVYGALADELAGPVHALALETKAPGEA